MKPRHARAYIVAIHIHTCVHSYILQALIYTHTTAHIHVDMITPDRKSVLLLYLMFMFALIIVGLYIHTHAHILHVHTGTCMCI